MAGLWDGASRQLVGRGGHTGVTGSSTDADLGAARRQDGMAAHNPVLRLEHLCQTVVAAPRFSDARAMTRTRASLRLVQMATPSHVTMLREISAAGDRGRTGALDVEWEGAHVTLFFMFGHPSHVVFEATDGRNLVGEPALDAFVAELPTEFQVAPWRRAMVTDDTLHCTAEDLMGLFQRRNPPVESDGKGAEPPAAAVAAEAFAPTTLAAVPPAPPATTEQPPFGLSDFPLLPLATTLWSDAAANVINLESAVPRLPDSLIVLAGPTCRGAAVVAGGRVTDAVWVNAAGGCLGEQASHALMNSLEGTLTAYGVEDPRVLTALPMLWRASKLGTGLPGGWLHTEDVVAEVRTSSRSCCLLVESADAGVALFAAGELVAVYTLSHRWPATSMAALRSLLHEPGARTTVLGDLNSDASAAATAPAEVAAESQPDAPETAAVESPATPEHAEISSEFAVDTEITAEADAVPNPDPDTQADAITEAAPEAEAVAPADADADAVADPPAAARPKGRGRRGKDKHNHEVAAAVTAAAEEPAAAEASIDIPDATAEPVAVAPPALVEPTPAAIDDFQFAPTPRPVANLDFEPAVFTIVDLAPERTEPEPITAEPAGDLSGMTGVEAREATEFVPARLDIDVDALRTELTDIATVWLGEDDAAPVAQAIGAARPGVDDFVSTIRAIGAMEIPGHESAVVRAMAREMHFRASEVLCGV